MLNTFRHFLFWHLGLAKAETQTTDDERACLANHAKEKQIVVEIGSWHGVTTKLLRSVMNSNGSLYAIDPYFPGRLGFSTQKYIAHHEVNLVKNGEIIWVQMTGIQAGMNLREKLMNQVDFIFIDGDHSYEGIKADWETWTPELVKIGGIIALHDSRSSSKRQIDDAGSVIFTNEVVRPDKRFMILDEVDSLTVLKKIA